MTIGARVDVRQSELIDRERRARRAPSAMRDGPIRCGVQTTPDVTSVRCFFSLRLRRELLSLAHVTDRGLPAAARTRVLRFRLSRISETSGCP